MLGRRHNVYTSVLKYLSEVGFLQPGDESYVTLLGVSCDEGPDRLALVQGGPDHRGSGPCRRALVRDPVCLRSMGSRVEAQ